MLKFSIIIPVYNAKATLRRCLDSILAQSFNNYEVLLMDDGSSDESYQICQEYQKKDKRFKAQYQSNKGPAAARNCCLNLAKGNWICFVDSDDTVSEYYLEQIYEVIIKENPEVIFFGCREIGEDNDDATEKLPISKKKSKYEQLVDLSKQDMFGYTCIKAFKKEVVGSIRFHEELILFEDEVFTCEVLITCKRIFLLPKILYNYFVEGENAITQKVHKDYCRNSGQVFESWRKLLIFYEDRDNALKEKANMLTKRCIYYGLEHDINIKYFFGELSKEEFFILHDDYGCLDKYIRNHNYLMIWIRKCAYRLKIKLSHCLGRKT